MELKLSSFNNASKLLAHSDFIPTKYIGEKIVFCVFRKTPKISKNGKPINNQKWKKVCISSCIVDPNTGHCDEIHYHQEVLANGSKTPIYRTLAKIVSEDWIVDENTRQLVVGTVFNNETKRRERFEKEYVR